MVALSRRIFKRGGNVPGFQQRIIGEDFFTAGAGSQQIEHVLDANTETPQAGPPAALGWIDDDAIRVNIRANLDIVNALITALIDQGALSGSVVDTIIAAGVAARLIKIERQRRDDWKKREQSAAAFVEKIESPPVTATAP
jgi:hypothetical protein